MSIILFFVLHRVSFSFQLASTKRHGLNMALHVANLSKTGKNDGKKGKAGTGRFVLEHIGNQGIKMVDPAGFEPATKGL